MFIKWVEEQLGKMSESEKDQWILSQAKLLEESEQQGFLMTLSGEKKITYMPTLDEIEKFCEQVESGIIYLEYETHYYEFDENGRYMDDWKSWHNDLFDAMPFLDKVFKGCHDLMILHEYAVVADILNRVCRLEFNVVESPDSDAYVEPDLSLFTIQDAEKEGLLSMKNCVIGADWVIAFIRGNDRWDNRELAKGLVQIFQQPVCKNINPDMLTIENLPEEVFVHMGEILSADILDHEAILEEKFSKSRFSHEGFLFEKRLERKKELELNISLKCIDDRENKSDQKVSILASSWEQIKELLEQLRYEPYIDDQWQIWEIGDICEALIKKIKPEEEDWKLRKEMLSDIIEADYYDYYGCYDPMHDLSEKLCTKPEEFLAFADILYEHGEYQEKAAQIYHQYGNDEKYVSYLETHLEKKSKTYVDLINYYKEHDNCDRARRVAEQALEKCKDDLTDSFIYLLMDAKKCEDKERYKKLYSSAKRRRAADISRIDKALSEL